MRAEIGTDNRMDTLEEFSLQSRLKVHQSRCWRSSLSNLATPGLAITRDWGQSYFKIKIEEHMKRKKKLRTNVTCLYSIVSAHSKCETNYLPFAQKILFK